MPFTFDKVVEYAFLAALTGGVGFIVRFLGKLSASAAQVNEKMAVIIDKVTTHDRKLEKHEDKIEEHDKDLAVLKARGPRR